MSHEIAMPPKITVVAVSGKLESGDTVSQDFPVRHEDGCHPGAIMGQAVNMFRQMGGIIVDMPDGGLAFHMASKFVGPINFSIKNVVLAGADSLPPKRSGLQLVQ